MSTRSRAATFSEPEEISIIVFLQQKLYENYTVLAYILIIVTVRQDLVFLYINLFLVLYSLWRIFIFSFIE